MKKAFIWFWIILLPAVAWFVISNNTQYESTNTEREDGEEANQVLFLPTDDFFERITKKPFGIYITPHNSPVQPERFTGFHTAVDVEYEDNKTDVPVYAMADGEVVTSRIASGYGGIVAINHRPQFKWYTIYGHLDPESTPPVGAKVSGGEQIAILGKGYSEETDGERKHLHFGIINQKRPNVAGYVSNESSLVGWLDPEEILAELE